MGTVVISKPGPGRGLMIARMVSDIVFPLL